MDTGDLENWVAEKLSLVTNKDCGNDEASTLNHITKHKVTYLQTMNNAGLLRC